jgi:hypothetical protein
MDREGMEEGDMEGIGGVGVWEWEYGRTGGLICGIEDGDKGILGV